MTIHLIKLCVGADSVDDLARWRDRRVREAKAAKRPPVMAHVTRMWPKREAEILDDGSLYWVIKGMIQARQRIEAFEETRGEDGIRRCRIVLDPDIVPTEIAPRRAFQGWRYFKPEDAPRDLATRGGDTPAELAVQLASLGLL